MSSTRERKDGGGSRPTIGLCIPAIAVGGAERQAIELARNLDRNRWRVLLLSFSDDGRSDVGGIEHFGIISGAVSRARHLRQVLVEERVDILQAYLVGAQLYGLLAKIQLPAIKLIAAVRSSATSREIAGWKGKLSHRAVFRLHDLVDRYVFNSVAADARLGQHLPPSKRQVIFNGIDTDKFRPDSAAKKILRERYRLGASGRIVGVLANVNPYKGYETLVRAAATVIRTFPDTHFAIAGEHQNPLGDRISALVAELNLAANWHFLGPVEDVGQFLAGLDVLCSSSWTEGFSNSVAEGMSCAVPCVVTDVGDSALIVGETGVVVPPNAPDALASGLVEMLNNGDAELARRGEEARDRIIKRFGLRRMIEEFEHLYSSMLDHTEAGQAVRG